METNLCYSRREGWNPFQAQALPLWLRVSAALIIPALLFFATLGHSHPTSREIVLWDINAVGELVLGLDPTHDNKIDLWLKWPVLAFSKTPAFCADSSSKNLMLFIPRGIIVSKEPNAVKHGREGPWKKWQPGEPQAKKIPVPPEAKPRK